MKKKIVIYFGFILLLFLFLFAGIYIGSNKRLKARFLNDGYNALDKLEATLYLIDKHYVDSVSTEKLVENLIPTLVRQLDPHSTYLTPEQKEMEREALDGFFYGIGVTFNTFSDTAVVVSVIPDGPSDIAGIKPGDRILSADSISLLNIPADSIRNILKGKNGSIVDLGVKSNFDGQHKNVEVRRGVVNVRQVESAFMVNDSLGCIKLSNFAHKTYNDFMQELSKLRAKGAKGLILDLRNNPGGLMQAALQIVNEMLPARSLIIYMEGKNYKRQEIYSDGTGTLIGFPIYVLVNDISASASEIISGAIQDNDAGIIIGRRTFGKGLVQKAFDFYDSSSVNLTIAHYYTPSGRSIQNKYSLGKAGEYTNEWLERYKNGELFHEDSIHLDLDLVAKTKGGRTVYGGGGITPDVFIPNDTTGYTSYFMQVYSSGLIQQFSFYYADKFRDLLTRLGDPENCYQFLQNQGLPWQLANYANSHGVRIRNYQVYLSQDRLSEMLYPLIIDHVFGADAAGLIRSKSDDMMAVAVRFFADGIYSPFDIPENDIALPDSILLPSKSNDEEFEE